MGDETVDALGEPVVGRPVKRHSKRTALIVIVVAVAVVAGGLGTWFAVSQPSGVARSDVVRLDKQRVVLDNSMNLYDPLVSHFSARYSNVISENAAEQEKDNVLKEEGDQLKQESRTNLDTLERMGASPALQEKDVAEAFGQFKDHYGAVISYNDQLVTNTANITRSLGGPCSTLHSTLNVGGETYSDDYVKAADACLDALATAKDGTDKETTGLLTDVEVIIRGQRDKQQEALDGKDDFERLAKRTIASLAMLEINEALSKAQTKYEDAVKGKYTQIVDSANASNAALESALKKTLEQFDAAAEGGK